MQGKVGMACIPNDLSTILISSEEGTGCSLFYFLLFFFFFCTSLGGQAIDFIVFYRCSVCERVLQSSYIAIQMCFTEFFVPCVLFVIFQVMSARSVASGNPLFLLLTTATRVRSK